MNYLCLLLSIFGIFPSAAIGVMTPLIAHGWPKGNPLKTCYAPSALKVNLLKKCLKDI